MKNVLKKITTLSLVFLLTGCYSLDAKMNIKDDKSLDFTVLHTINEPAYEAYTKNMDNPKTINELLEVEKINKNLLSRGYKVEEYNKNSQKGLLISKSFDNIDEISKEGDEVRVELTKIAEDDFDDNLFFTVKKGILYNTYTATFIFNTKKEQTGNSSLNYEVILPVKTIENNATSISADGKSLTWKLKENDITEVNYSFKLAEKYNLYFAYGSIGLIILLIVIAIGTAIGNNKRKKNQFKKPQEQNEKEKIEIKNDGIDLMKEQTQLIAGGHDLMSTEPNINNIVAPLHPTEGISVAIDAPAVTIDVNPTNQQINEENKFIQNEEPQEQNFTDVFEHSFEDNKAITNESVVEINNSVTDDINTLESNPLNKDLYVNNIPSEIPEINNIEQSIPEIESRNIENIHQQSNDVNVPVLDDNIDRPVVIETEPPKIILPNDVSVIEGVEDIPTIIPEYNSDPIPNFDINNNQINETVIEQSIINNQSNENSIIKPLPIEEESSQNNLFDNLINNPVPKIQENTHNQFVENINSQNIANENETIESKMDFTFDLTNQKINTNIESTIVKETPVIEENNINMNFDFDLTNQSINSEPAITKEPIIKQVPQDNLENTQTIIQNIVEEPTKNNEGLL